MPRLLGEVVALAGRALVANRFRTLLTMLSITTGTFTIVLMSSLAKSGLETLQFGIEELGSTRLVLVTSRDPVRAEAKQASYARGLHLVDRDRIAERIPHVNESSLSTTVGMYDALSETGEGVRTDLVAGDGAFFEVFRMRIGLGRAFTEEENRAHAQVCVVGHKVAAKLWTGSPVGRMLTIGPMRCRVVGQFADNERFGIDFGFEWTDLVVVPFETAADAIATVHDEAQLVVKTDSPASNDAVMRILNARLIARHHGVDDFTLMNLGTAIEKFKMVFAVMQALVGVVAGIALLIGGVGVMNMMLVSVSERVREIGIRKALGARPGDIGAQFIAEAVLLSGVGGAVGVGAGVGVALLASIGIHSLLPTWQGSISHGAALAALVLSVTVGVGFGYFPARRAGRLDPIVAMRR